MDREKMEKVCFDVTDVFAKHKLRPSEAFMVFHTIQESLRMEKMVKMLEHAGILPEGVVPKNIKERLDRQEAKKHGN